VSKEVKQIAWLVLQAVNRTQTKGSTARLAVPRDQDVVDQLGIDITDKEMLPVEEYLENSGYLELADISLTRGTYTITPAGLKWLEGEGPGARPSDETLEESPEGTQPTSAAGEGREPAQGPQPRSWWQRMFGGS
jgi:hypothetical protein